MDYMPSAALDVQPIESPSYGDLLAKRDAYVAAQTTKRQNAMLSQAYAAAYDPKTGTLNTNALYGSLAQMGLGSQIPATMEAYGKGQEAVAKARTEGQKLSDAQYAHGMKALTDARDVLSLATSPDDLIRRAQDFATAHPEARDGIAQSVQRIMNNPAGWQAGVKAAAMENLTAQERLKQHFTQQNLGGSVREVAMPEYGSGAATVVPGSEAQMTMTPNQQWQAQHPNLKVVQGEGGYYGVDLRTGTAAPITMGGGGGGIAPSQYGNAIEAAAKQLSPGLIVSGRGRTAERNAEVGGVSNSYHLTDNARDFQPARGQTLDQLAASFGPLKQQGFDVIIERGKNHVHVEPGPHMAGSGAGEVPAGRGNAGTQVSAPSKQPKATAATKATAAPEANQSGKTEPEMASAVQHLYDLIQDAHKKGHITAGDQSWVANRMQEATVGRPWLPGGTAQKTSLDSIDKTAKQIMRLSIKPGTSGTLRAVAEQQMFLQSVGGGDASYETRLDAVRQFAEQHGIKLKGQGSTATESSTGDPEMDAIMRKHGGKK